jgi:anti-sigma regulatory factor (Ser/Thr protein kinase)
MDGRTMAEQIPGNHPQSTATGLCWHTLAEISAPSRSADPQLIQAWVVEATQALSLPESDLERIQWATAEAVLNRNGRSANAPQAGLLEIRLLLAVQQTEGEETADVGMAHGRSDVLPPATLDGRRAEHGWGFFLLERMAASVQGDHHETKYVIELYLY